jgi:CDP-paratose 2-epimerase
VKLLITGGCGFLGSNLGAHAISRGDELVVLDSLARIGARQNLAWLQSLGKVDIVQGDIRSRDEVERVVSSFRPQVVFHLAGQVAMTTSVADPRMDFEVNALGTINVLEAIRLHAPTAAVLYSSTNKVYGSLEQFSYRETASRYECIERPNGFAEDTPLEFSSPYGCSKGAADQYLLDYARIFGLRTTVFRHSSMYGGRQFATYDQGWIGWFCQQALDTRSGKLKKPFTISGNGKQVRDVLHSEDMVRLYFLAAERIEALKGQAFNVGGGISNSLSLLELLGLLADRLGVALHPTQLPARLSDQRVFVADIAKIQAHLDWRPRVGCQEGIEKMLVWLGNGHAQAVPSAATP